MRWSSECIHEANGAGPFIACARRRLRRPSRPTTREPATARALTGVRSRAQVVLVPTPLPDLLASARGDLLVRRGRRLDGSLVHFPPGTPGWWRRARAAPSSAQRCGVRFDSRVDPRHRRLSRAALTAIRRRVRRTLVFKGAPPCCSGRHHQGTGLLPRWAPWTVAHNSSPSATPRTPRILPLLLFGRVSRRDPFSQGRAEPRAPKETATRDRAHRGARATDLSALPGFRSALPPGTRPTARGSPARHARACWCRALRGGKSTITGLLVSGSAPGRSLCLLDPRMTTRRAESKHRGLAARRRGLAPPQAAAPARPGCCADLSARLWREVIYATRSLPSSRPGRAASGLPHWLIDEAPHLARRGLGGGGLVQPAPKSLALITISADSFRRLRREIRTMPRRTDRGSCRPTARPRRACSCPGMASGPRVRSGSPARGSTADTSASNRSGYRRSRFFSGTPSHRLNLRAATHALLQWPRASTIPPVRTTCTAETTRAGSARLSRTPRGRRCSASSAPATSRPATPPPRLKSPPRALRLIAEERHTRGRPPGAPFPMLSPISGTAVIWGHSRIAGTFLRYTTLTLGWRDVRARKRRRYTRRSARRAGGSCARAHLNPDRARSCDHRRPSSWSELRAPCRPGRAQRASLPFDAQTPQASWATRNIPGHVQDTCRRQACCPLPCRSFFCDTSFFLRADPADTHIPGSRSHHRGDGTARRSVDHVGRCQ